jgi:putative spermidine/putrescine transport system permease protein
VVEALSCPFCLHLPNGWGRLLPKSECPRQCLTTMSMSVQSLTRSMQHHSGWLVRQVRRHWAILPGAVLLAVIFIWPVVKVLLLSFSSKGNYSSLDNSVTIDIIWRTVKISFIVTLVALFIAIPYAYIAAHVASSRIGRAMIIAATCSLFVSIVVRGYAWTALLSRGGVLDKTAQALGMSSVVLVPSFSGIIIGMSQYAIPLMALPVYSSMVRYDADLNRAAASLGARPTATFVRIYIPHILSGIGAGCATVFTVTLGYYVLPEILGGPSNEMIGAIIAQQVQNNVDFGTASAIGVVLLCVALISFMVIFRATRRDYH